MSKIDSGSHNVPKPSSDNVFNTKDAINKEEKNLSKARRVLVKRNVDDNASDLKEKNIHEDRKTGHLPKDFTAPSLIKEFDTLGSGGYGDVMKGMSDSNTGVAVKTQRGARGLGMKFEENILRQLDHPNIIKVHGEESIAYREQNLDVDNETPKLNTTQKPTAITDDWVVVSNDILALEIGSIDLYDLITQTKLTEQQKIAFACDICAGAAYLNEKGICHQDLKPQNIILVHGTAKITDFGVAVQFIDKNGEVIPSKSELYTQGTQNFQPYESLTNRLKSVADEKIQQVVPSVTDPTKVDSWGCGIILGFLLSSGQEIGLQPHTLITLKSLYDAYDKQCKDNLGRNENSTEDMNEILLKTQHAYQTMLDDYFAKASNVALEDGIPEDALPILKGLLAIHPENRMSTQEAFERLSELKSIREKLLQNKQTGQLPDDCAQHGLIKEADQKTDKSFSKGVLQGELDANDTAVVIKKCRQNEINIASQLDHPNIIKMHGESNLSYSEQNLDDGINTEKTKTETDDWIVVSNNMMAHEVPSANLYDMIQNTELTEQQKIAFACDICAGTAYLGEKGICHLNLQPNSILIVDGNAKSSDFVVATEFKDENGSVIPSKGNSYTSGVPNYKPYESTTNTLKLYAGEKRKALVSNIKDPAKIDSWGCGIILGYLLSSGEHTELSDDTLEKLKPLYSDFDFEREDEFGRSIRHDMNETLLKTKHAYEKMLENYFEKTADKIPTGTMPILKGLLAIKPEDRMSAQEAFERLSKLKSISV